MPPTLPRTAQLKLEQTLSQWSHWRCSPALTRAPTILGTLGSGISNHSILVESGPRFVVRIDGINPASNGLNRQCEWRVLHSANQAGLAPRPCYFNPDLGSLVCDYLEPDVTQDKSPAAVGKLLHAIHQLPSRHHRLDLAERILRYEKLLEHTTGTLGTTILSCREKISGLLSQLGEQTYTAVLCHHDLLQANRISSAGKLWAIDWEYCAMGNPWYDIAVVAHGDALDAAEIEELLHAYLDREPSINERTTLRHYACVYGYLELLWYEAQPHPILCADTLAQKQSVLLEMLKNEPA